ncbi:MAG: glycosyltransferase family 2 protein [Flavobacteriaceae bacterium]|nr:glycosyltransferase family 2 protein [Flavobacteriaceae bacterium]
MTLSVVILNYNVRYFLELCLSSVMEAIKGVDAEIIVVDNNSTDDSCEMVSKKFPDVNLIRNSENFGFSKGNNIGVQKARGEYLCILNPDTIVGEELFKDVLEFMESREDLGAMGCRLIDGRGVYLPESKRNIPTPGVAFRKLLGWEKSYYATHIEELETAAVDILVGAFMCIKRSVYRDTGGFDESYFMYGEDIDLSYSLLQKGFSNYYFGKTTLIHFKGESTSKDANYRERFYGAMYIFFKKYFKSNIIFRFLVWIGLKMASLRVKQSDKPVQADEHLFYIGAIIPDCIADRFGDKVSVISASIQPEPGSTVILDPANLKFKAIIDYLDKHHDIPGIRFLIRLKNDDVLIGSHHRSSRGEVIFCG